jgi:hypothetical protein
MAETVGQRLYLVRLAWGDGVRKPESLKSFSVRVKRTTKQHYDPMTLSKLERMKQTWKLEDVANFAMVDKLRRGERWLAFGVKENDEVWYPTPEQQSAIADAKKPPTISRATGSSGRKR